jgi:hypothetical protein
VLRIAIKYMQWIWHQHFFVNHLTLAITKVAFYTGWFIWDARVLEAYNFATRARNQMKPRWWIHEFTVNWMTLHASEASSTCFRSFVQEL